MSGTGIYDAASLRWAAGRRIGGLSRTSMALMRALRRKSWSWMRFSRWEASTEPSCVWTRRGRCTPSPSPSKWPRGTGACPQGPASGRRQLCDNPGLPHDSQGTPVPLSLCSQLCPWGSPAR